MASMVTPKRATAFTFLTSLTSQADVKLFQDNPTLAAGDVVIIKDGVLDGNIDTLPAAVTSATRVLKVDLSASEMTADNVTVIFHDAAGAEWCDLVINIQTSTRQVDDLAFPTTSGRSLDVTATGAAGIDWANVEAPTTTVGLSGTTVKAVTDGVSLADNAITSAKFDGRTAFPQTEGDVAEMVLTPDQVEAITRTQAAHIIGYWPLSELVGTVAYDASGNGRNAAYVGPSFALGQTGTGDGETSVSVTADAVNLYTAALGTAFNGAAGTVMFWAKVSAAGVWTDGTERYLLSIYADGNNSLSVYRQASDYVLSWYFNAGGTAEAISPDLSISSTGWMHIAMTWDKAADKVIAYLDSRPIQATATGVGAWTGSGLSSAITCLGALRSDSYANPFTGNLAHAAIWDVALSGTEIEAIHDALRPTYGMICLGDSKSDADAWIGELCTSLGAAVGRRVEQRPLFYAVGGYTIAQLATLVSANVGTEYTTPRYATINIGANDMNPLPSATTWKGNLTTIINTLRDKWPSILIYVAKPWRQGEDADSTTMAGWIDTVIATYASGVYAGPNESVWLKGSDDGATNTTDGIHYSVAGNTACAAQWLALMA